MQNKIQLAIEEGERFAIDNCWGRGELYTLITGYYGCGVACLSSNLLSRIINPDNTRSNWVCCSMPVRWYD